MTITRNSALALAFAGVCATASAAGNLVIAPASSSVGPFAAFSLTVRGEGFTENVIGGGFSLSFDPAVLTLSSVTVNTALWEFAPGTGTIDNAAGTLSNVSFNSFVNAPSGGFEAATLNFVAAAGGSSAVTLAASALFPFASTLGTPIAVSYGAGNVAVVPEPATALTMLLGMALVPLLRRPVRDA